MTFLSIVIFKYDESMTFEKEKYISRCEFYN